jgi:D-apionolactonase
MNTPATTVLVHGVPAPPTPPIGLRAGPLTLDFDAGDLRDIRLDGREIIRRVYGAVRDREWGTVPAEITGLVSEIAENSFNIRYLSTHRRDGIHFEWRATLVGDSAGTLRFDFDGEARTGFPRNRIGLCVLHPMRECTGARVCAMAAKGAERDLRFPKTIAVEQPVRGFESLVRLSHEIESDLWVEMHFTGELFDTEDQRNWIDASFKTFGTPLHLPIPVDVKPGDRVRQSVEIRLVNSARRPLSPRRPVPQPRRKGAGDAPAVSVEAPEGGWVRLPELGLGAACHRRPEADSDLTRLAALSLCHLRADVRLADPDWRRRLRDDARAATALGVSLELAVHLPQEWSEHELGMLGPELTRLRADVSRVLALQDGIRSTTAEALAAARAHLGDLEVPVGAGTSGDLYQLNLQRPPGDADFIFWSMNPQVHAIDTRSLMETWEAAAAQISSVREYYPAKPLAVSPITLRPRPGPAHAGAAGSGTEFTPPPHADPRQMSLAGAAWTVSMLSALAPSGAESLTFFETTGWLGVMETVRESLKPHRNPSFAGCVYPVWHVFAALGGFRSAAAALVGELRTVAAVALGDRAGRRRLVVANLKPGGVEVRLGGGDAILRLLDASTVADAIREPEAFWRQPGVPAEKHVHLSAHAVAFIDLA